MSRLSENLAEFGALEKDCVELCKTSDPRLLRYADLLRSSSVQIDAVVEQQSRAMLYVVDRTSLHNQGIPADVENLRRALAMRGEQAWLGVLRPGWLDIYSTDLQPDPNTSPVSFSGNSDSSQGVLPRLVNGEELTAVSNLVLRDVLFGLMTQAAEELRNMGLSADESIALTGRALFFRYLVGRRIIEERHLRSITAHAETLVHCFSNAHALTETNKWLDITFNGDLLPLPTQDYEEYFVSLTTEHGKNLFTRPLRAILGMDTPLEPGASQQQLQWKDLDFHHLPIGLLSETYEELMYRLERAARYETSVYYTPAHIAEYMVEEAFHQHPAGSTTRVLDPACGAGIFLTVCLRKLAELHFLETGQRPGRKVLRRLLNTKLTGFDTNVHARTLAALALYLTALELDPDPTPVEDLSFDKLEGKVLIDVADPGSDPRVIAPMAGSLGEHISNEYQNAFDLVIGNPPWTSLKNEYAAIDKLFTKRCREIAERRGLSEIARNYKNPDMVPDLPFVWGAMDWAKPNGRIALALAGRLLFKMSDNGFKARSAVFQALAITGVLNGASIRQSKVWPNTDQPFCLVFADNRVPEPDDRFILVSPEEETALSKQGRMRIDANDAVPVECALVANIPHAINVLYRGTTLDLEVLNNLRSRTSSTIGEYWEQQVGLESGQGYKTGTRTKDDSFLNNYPSLQAKYKHHPYLVITKKLDQYQPEGLERPRDPGIYEAPVVVIRKTIRSDRNRGRALISYSKLAYPEAYFGFSVAKHNHGEFIARYLLVLIHSQIFEYYALMQCGQFGREREVLQMQDIKRFPFVPPTEVNDELKKGIDHCAARLIDNKPDWARLDEVVAKVYGFGNNDLIIINDTLATRAPFRVAKERAVSPPSTVQTKKFLRHLQDEMAAVLSAGNKVVHSLLIDYSGSDIPWRFFSISLDAEPISTRIPSRWIEHADNLATSRITIVDADRPQVTIGLLNQYRYWTPTQARMLAAAILWQYGAMLEERVKK